MDSKAFGETWETMVRQRAMSYSLLFRVFASIGRMPRSLKCKMIIPVYPVSRARAGSDRKLFAGCEDSMTHFGVGT